MFSSPPCKRRKEANRPPKSAGEDQPPRPARRAPAYINRTAEHATTPHRIAPPPPNPRSSQLQHTLFCSCACPALTRSKRIRAQDSGPTRGGWRRRSPPPTAAAASGPSSPPATGTSSSATPASRSNHPPFSAFAFLPPQLPIR